MQALESCYRQDSDPNASQFNNKNMDQDFTVLSSLYGQENSINTYVTCSLVGNLSPADWICLRIFSEFEDL